METVDEESIPIYFILFYTQKHNDLHKTGTKENQHGLMYRFSCKVSLTKSETKICMGVDLNKCRTEC